MRITYGAGQLSIDLELTQVTIRTIVAYPIGSRRQFPSRTVLARREGYHWPGRSWERPDGVCKTYY